MKLPDLEYHTVETLSHELGCYPSRILLHIEQGKIKASVKNKGWRIEYGNMDEHDKCGHLPVMKDISRLPDKHLILRPWTVEEIRCNGSVDKPEFEYQDYDYARIYSDDEEAVFRIGVQDIIFDKATVQSLSNLDETDKSEQKSIATAQHQKSVEEAVSGVLTKTTLKDMEPVYYERAMHFMHKCEKTHKKEPTRDQVADYLFDLKLSDHSRGSIVKTLDKRELCLQYAQYKKSLSSMI